MHQSLFTLLAEYDGGTFVSQVCAPDVCTALSIWIDEVAPSIATLNFDRRILERLRREVDRKDAGPIVVTGLDNVWCGLSATIRGKLLLVNVVKTQSSNRHQTEALARNGGLRHSLDERNERKQPNQALQTTSITRSGFGKIAVSDRQRRGV